MYLHPDMTAQLAASRVSDLRAAAAHHQLAQINRPKPKINRIFGKAVAFRRQRMALASSYS